jgi:hypothetical protein
MKRFCSYSAVFFLLVHTLFVPRGYTAFEYFPLGARSAALSGACVALPLGPESVFYNPAACVLPQQRSLLVYYARPYGLRELEMAAFSYLHGAETVTALVAATMVGGEFYRERTLYAAVAGNIAPTIQVGATAKLYHVAIAGYGASMSVGIDCGVYVRISPSVRWGICAANVNRPRIGACREALPQQLSAGFSARPLKTLHLSADIVKDVRYPAEFRFGAGIALAGFLTVQFGIRTAPARNSRGVRLFFKNARVDYGLCTHYDLGLTHMFSLSYSLKR